MKSFFDGLRPDALEQAVKELEEEGGADEFVRLFEEGTYDLDTFAGGVKGSETQQPTVSGPAWTSVFTGVYANQHAIRSNEDFYAGRLNNTIPTLYNYIYHNVYNPYTAAIYDWKPLGTLLKSTVNGAGPDDVFEKEGLDVATAWQFSRENAGLALHILRHRDPQLLFLYTVAVDEVGHHSGFGPENPEYMDAIKRVARQWEPVLARIQEKRSEGKEWLIYVVTDHGGDGNNHGDQKDLNRRTFQVWENPSDAQFAGLGSVRTGRGLDAVTPTILRFLMGDDYDAAKFPLLKDPVDTRKEVPAPPARTEAAAASSAVFLSSSILLTILAIL